jgi:cold shock CspA family protein
MTTIRDAGAILHQPRFDKALSDHLTSLSAPRARNQSSKETTTVHLGTCCRWAEYGSFGFVTSDARLDGIGEDRDVYCHRSKLPKGITSLVPGMRVEFQLIPAHVQGRPPQAKVLRIITETAEAA